MRMLGILASICGLLLLGSFFIAEPVQTKRRLSAYIYESPKSCNDSEGVQIFVKNRLPDKSVLATVEITSSWVGVATLSQEVHSIPAGGRTLIGCSKTGNGGEINQVSYAYEVVGCETIQTIFQNCCETKREAKMK